MDVEALKARMDHAELEIATLKQQNEQLEIASRSRNLVVFGVKEGTGIEGVRSLFAGEPDLPDLSTQILEISRIGRYTARPAKPWPLRIILSTSDARRAAFKHTRRLRDREIFLRGSHTHAANNQEALNPRASAATSRRLCCIIPRIIHHHLS
jgi:hypothetical protein